MKTKLLSQKRLSQFLFTLGLFLMFANIATAQDTFTWNATSGNWANAANWTKTGTNGTDTWPGQTRSTDLVVISNGGTPLLASTNTVIIRRLSISNATGAESGSVLTINGSLTVSQTANQLVLLNGGSIVNNGTLAITNSSYTAATSQPVVLGTPTVAPTIAREYGYSGTGTLSVTMAAGALTNSAAFTHTSANANTTYRLNLTENKTTITLGTNPAVSIFVFRPTGTSPLIVGGTGLTLGTVESPVVGGLFTLSGGQTVTVDTGTVLTLNSATTNNVHAISSFVSTAVTTTFTNKGTINILGSSRQSGMGISSGSTSNASVWNISNHGTLNINLNCSVVGKAPLNIGNGGGGAVNAGTRVNIANTSTGSMTLKNTSTAIGTGSSIFCVSASESAPMFITNDGTLNLEGTSYSLGLKTTITNNGILNSNSELRSFVLVDNTSTGSLNFARTASTATTRAVTFNGLQSTALSGSIGSVYTDGTNNYAVVIQKFSGNTTLVANVLSSATIGTGAGSLSIVSGGNTNPITFTSVSVAALNNALATTTTNAGTINTDTASNLNIISGVTTTATSVIAPGGSAGKGIASFSAASQTILGTLAIQVSGSTTAGVDFDQITNLTTNGGFTVSNATLDVTGIYTPTGVTVIDIIVANGSGTITGPFASVTGLPSGWAVNYDTVGKVQLMYGTTWNGSAWSNGTPDATVDAVIDGTYGTTANGTFTAKSLTVNADKEFTVNSTTSITVQNTVTNNGTLTIQNNANLIQVNDVANTGNATVNRNSNALSRLDFTLWSSPVNGAQTLAGFSPNTSQNPSRFYYYNESTNAYNAITSPTSTTFASAQGYLIRMPNNAVTAPATQPFAAAFTGVPNNGTITKSLEYSGASNGYNAIGNPYPSTINAEAFITANTANIESSLYFWRKVNAADGSSYAVYNPMGSTTATPSSALPNGIIQVGQGFFVKAKSASSVNFTNAMRVTNTDNQFFKTKAAQKDRLWLNLTNATGAFSQALIGYTADATSGVDMYDAKYINDSPIALTSSINGEEYSIQGRPAFDATDVVALNFKTDVAGDYTIALDHFDGAFATGQDVYLVDSKTGAETNLKDGGYTFNATVGTDNTRFSLKFQKTLKVIDAALDNNSVSVYLNEGAIYINSKSAAIRSVKVFDVQGRLLTEQRNVNANTAVISNLRAKNQILIVNVVGEDNSEVSKKIMN